MGDLGFEGYECLSRNISKPRSLQKPAEKTCFGFLPLVCLSSFTSLFALYQILHTKQHQFTAKYFAQWSQRQHLTLAPLTTDQISKVEKIHYHFSLMFDV